MSHLSRVLLTSLAVFLFGALTPAFADNIAFEFNTPGVLPSSQGAIYLGNVPEASAYSVSGGLLHQNTTVFGSDVFARYNAPAGTFNHNFDATLEWRAQVFVNQQVAVQIALFDNSSLHAWNFNLATFGVQQINGGFNTIVPMNTTDALHSYRVVIPAGSSVFSLFVDDVLRYTGNGTAFTVLEPFPLLWGDGTPTGGNGQADWDYIRLTNPTTQQPIPEPTTMLLLGTGLAGVGAAVRRRRKAGKSEDA